MKQNRKWILILSIVLSVAIAAGGTMAYLQDTDEDVNVMTLGKVDIRQHEYERVQNADGTYATIETESGTGYKLKDFSQDKPLFPAVGDYTVMDKTLVYFDQLGENAGGEAGVAGQLENVQDKFVVVENYGKSDAYVRTLFAFEGTDALTEYLGLGITEDWAWNDPKLEIVVDGATYVVMEAVYVGSDDRHADGILPAGEWTPSSLSQVFLAPEATNEVVEGLDTNKNGKYDILVLSQAVQVQGFEGLGADGKSDAQNALDTAFGLVNEINSTEWFNDVYARYKKQSEEDHWDGTVDTSWYNDTDTEFVLTTAEQLAGLAELVDGGNSFEGKTVKLGNNICLGCTTGECEVVKNDVRKTFDPIGDVSAFSGIFDGDGNTISNLYQSGWDLGYEWGSYGSIGLFGELKSATVKNLTIAGFETFVEGGDVALIAGSATGTCVFENLTFEDSVAATYNNGCGSIIGWSGAGNYTFRNIVIGEDVVLAGLWGSFDSSIGGVVGQGEPGATYNFENVDIACRIDAYNDCTASNDFYNYRMCGMIIGRLEETTTIDGVNYPDTSKYNITCNNVNVTYGDWANYHYCEPTPGLNGGRGMRVEPGYAYDGLPADFDHSLCTTNHNTLMPFDQVFGGDQYGVKGLKTYEGVNVVYNNK